MKIVTLIAFLFIASIMNAQDNTLTSQEKKEGWKLLFDGKTTVGWRGYNKQTFPEKGWNIDQASLHCISKARGGDILFDEKFTNFELVLDWKISEGGNSGIFIFAHELQGQPIFHSAPEMQVLDNERHPDAKLGRNGNRMAGSLYDLIPAVPQNAKPAGQWNHVKIVAINRHVEFWQNNVRVVTFTMGTDAWKKMCADSKFNDMPEFVNNTGKDGYFGLQDHGDEVWFKNIKVRIPLL